MRHHPYGPDRGLLFLVEPLGTAADMDCDVVHYIRGSLDRRLATGIPCQQRLMKGTLEMSIMICACKEEVACSAYERHRAHPTRYRHSVCKRCTLSRSGFALVHAGVVYADVDLQDLHWQDWVINNSRACFRLDRTHESKNEVRLFSRHLPIIHYPPKTH